MSERPGIFVAMAAEGHGAADPRNVVFGATRVTCSRCACWCWISPAGFRIVEDKGLPIMCVSCAKIASGGKIAPTEAPSPEQVAEIRRHLERR